MYALLFMQLFNSCLLYGLQQFKIKSSFVSFWGFLGFFFSFFFLFVCFLSFLFLFIIIHFYYLCNCIKNVLIFIIVFLRTKMDFYTLRCSSRPIRIKKTQLFMAKMRKLITLQLSFQWFHP